MHGNCLIICPSVVGKPRGWVMCDVSGFPSHFAGSLQQAVRDIQGCEIAEIIDLCKNDDALAVQ